MQSRKLGRQRREERVSQVLRQSQVVETESQETESRYSEESESQETDIKTVTPGACVWDPVLLTGVPAASPAIEF